MLVQIDAAQLEWRVAAFLSNDEVAIKEINDGIDFHTENQKTFSLPSRLIAKIYLFRTIFRGSGWAFANDPDFSGVSNDPDYWDQVNEKFYNKYKGLDRWHTKLGQLVASGKPIVSPFGREWLIPLRENGTIPWTVLSNYPVQGTAADLMMIGRISLFNRMKKLSMKSLLVSTVHDSIVLDCPKSEVKEVSRLTISVFNDIPKNVKKLFGITLPIPFPGEVKVGHNLKEMEEL